MGIGLDSAWFLLEARRKGCAFGKLVTIGRQQISAEATALQALCARMNAEPPSGLERRAFAEPFFSETLGATAVTCLDASPYQGAGLVHDLNQPIPEALEERFNTLFDGGSLEHVFNVPVAVANYMRLVRPGGHLFVATTANNYFGHGFYQFSSEFFYRVFDAGNGFAVRRLVISEHDSGGARLGPCFEARDPAEVGRRTSLVNDKPLLIMMQAERVSRQPLFAAAPQQSNYSARWDGAEDANPKSKTARRRSSFLDWLKQARRRRRKAERDSLRNAKHFPPV